ncbi:MAG: hypothetical protein KKB31_04590 [Nanoarchaeota archaeon]|nr:hypothetical protein [Nanoarchaeota archaeon]
MPQQDTSDVRDKIISFLRRKGPSLPVHIAGEINTSILFAGAFLSELLADKKVKTSNMRVGSSPLYFLPGQEYMVERFSHHLKSKERDAYELLKQKRFLKDEIQHPAIRVALREIRDFAIPFKKNNEIYWRYHSIPESEFQVQEEKRRITQEEPKKDIPPERITTRPEEKKEKLDIFDKKPEQKIEEEKTTIIFSKNIKRKEKKKEKPKKQAKKSLVDKKEEKFFGSVKEFLSKKEIEILEFESFGKTDLTLKIKDKEEKLLMAFNKKKIDEKDILKAHKKAQEKGLPYIILSLGEPSKSLYEFIGAIKNLSSIEKL